MLGIRVRTRIGWRSRSRVRTPTLHRLSEAAHEFQPTQNRDTVPAASPLAPRAGKKSGEYGGHRRGRTSLITHGRGTSCDHNLHVVSYLAKVDLLCSTPAASTNNRRIHSRIPTFSRAVPAASPWAPRMQPNLGECEWFSQLWLLDFLRDFDDCDGRRIRQPTGI
jgi:hypothetical protein